jgi:hypothetical protein
MVMRAISWAMFERPANNKTLADFVQELEDSQGTIAERIQQAEENDKNHDQITHIIGIERWAQEKLQEALGAPPYEDEYDNYRPPTTTRWQDLLPLFESVRKDTITLTKELEQVDPDTKIKHNQFGEMTIKAWLQYITGHATMEAKRIN